MGNTRLMVKEEKSSQEIGKTVTYDKTEIERLVARSADGDFEAFGEISV